MAMDDPVFIGVLAALIAAFVMVGLRSRGRGGSVHHENPFAEDGDLSADR